MNRRLTAALLVLAVVTAGVAPLVAATTTPSDAGTESDVTPGQRLAAAVGSQGAELRGEVDVRVLETRLNRSASNDSKAVVLAETVTDIETAIEELRTDQEQIAAQYENGTISFGEYAARSAQLVARERALTRVLNVSADRVRDLPEAALQNRGVSLEKISELRQAARNASGQAIAEIARQIAGPPTNVTNRSGGPPNGAADSASGPAVGAAAQEVRTAEQRVTTANRTVDSGEAAETLAEARATLEEARSRLSAARDAADAGEHDRARDLAGEAEELAEEAIELVEDARQQASEAGSGNQAGQGDADDQEESEASDKGSSIPDAEN